jgi:hypothetical protein
MAGNPGGEVEFLLPARIRFRFRRARVIVRIAARRRNERPFVSIG